MKLIVGLGNPGEKYEATRHNVGFDALDSFAKENQITFKYEPSYEGMIGTYINNGKKAILLKPTTFMNLSGRSVFKVMNYFKIDITDILVISDDVNLDVGQLRLRLSGSDGGHNGLKDIIRILESDNFKRLRVGISKNGNMIDFVLKKFSKKEREVIDVSLNVVKDALTDFIEEVDFERIMSKYNSKKV